MDAAQMCGAGSRVYLNSSSVPEKCLREYRRWLLSAMLDSA